MPIKFIEEAPIKNDELTFEMVENNQFFISQHGQLCQKYNSGTYHIIANMLHEPECHPIDGIDPCTPIIKILPKITRIEF